MNRHLLLILILGLVICCQDPQSADPVDTGYYLEYSRVGGFGGFHDKLTLDTDGTVKATQKVYQVSAVVNQQIRDIWWERLIGVDFFNLDDEITLEDNVDDALFYGLTVEYQGISNSVSVTAGGVHPVGFYELVSDLYYELFVPIYRDSATLGTVFSTKYQVRSWPFITGVALREHGPGEYFYFDEIDSTGEIEDYLRALYSPDGDYVSDIYHLHQEDDSLYILILRSDGFYIKSVHPVRYWPEDLGISLGDITDEGVVVEDVLYNQVKALLIEPLYINSIFIEAPAAEDVVAYYVTLRNGVYVGWQ